MRTRIDGEARERLRQLLMARARPFGLTPAAVEAMAGAAALERWTMGDAIETADVEGERVGLVVVGAVKVATETPHGKRVGVCFVPPGRFFTGSWPGDERRIGRELHLVAHDPLGTTIAWWGPRALADVMAALAPAQAVQVLAAVWRGASAVAREKCHLLALPLRDRVLTVLTALARDFGRAHPDGLRIELRITHADLASAAVGSRANVTRAMEELRATGDVAVEHHRLIVTHRGLAVLSSASSPGGGAAGCGPIAVSQ
jgi:CRP-like cAMP-binding protein